MTVEIPDEYISGNILKKPKLVNGKLIKGAIILSQVDYVVENIPHLKDFFYTIERRGWRGLNESKFADIKLVEDLSLWKETIEKFPDSICLDIGPADFVDTDSFYPLKNQKIYDGIQISSWDKFKRPLLFIQACSLLPNKKFIKLGHFVRKGNLEEIELRDKCLDLVKVYKANIFFPFKYQNNNDNLPQEKKELNIFINSASIGILTSEVEGINRFKMECLSANIPFLVPKDAAYPTKKHINEKTGLLYDATPEGLAKAIEYLTENIKLFSPRDYVLKNTGKHNSLNKLKEALMKLSIRDSQEYSFNDIDWDGRNNSLIWGRKNLFPVIKDAIDSLRVSL